MTPRFARTVVERPIVAARAPFYQGPTASYHHLPAVVFHCCLTRRRVVGEGEGEEVGWAEEGDSERRTT